MQKETRALTIVETPNSEEPNYFVDSTTFPLFLVGDQIIPERNFASQLDLATYTPFLKELAARSQNVFVFPDDQRQTVNEWKKEAASAPEVIRGRLEESLKRDEAFLNIQAPGERSRSIYYDTQQEAVAATEPVFGDYTRVEVAEDINNALERGWLMLHAHTHPKSVLPSPADYGLLIRNVFDEGRGIANGIVVLCPDIQILGLATAETPLMNEEEYETWRGGWQQRLSDEDKEKRAKLTRKVDLIKSDIPQAGHRLLRSTLEKIASAEERMKAGEISQEALEEIIASLKESVAEEGEMSKRKHVEGFKRMHDRLVETTELAYNKVLIELARSLHIKLYSSTNMQDFYEFSA